MTAAPEGAASGISAVILAGGRSSRFGSDKLVADLDGAPLVHHVLRAAAQVSDELVVVISQGHVGPPLPGELGRPVVTVRDTDDYPGPLAALVIGARAASHDRLLVTGGDMPDVRAGVLRRLGRWGHGVGACLLWGGERQVLPLGLARDAALSHGQRLLAARERSLRAMIRELDLEAIPESEWRADDPDGASLRDIDRPEDLARRAGPQ